MYCAICMSISFFVVMCEHQIYALQRNSNSNTSFFGESWLSLSNEFEHTYNWTEWAPSLNRSESSSLRYISQALIFEDQILVLDFISRYQKESSQICDFLVGNNLLSKFRYQKFKLKERKNEHALNTSLLFDHQCSAVAQRQWKKFLLGNLQWAGVCHQLKWYH